MLLFKHCTIAAFIVVFGCLAFLFNAVLSPLTPDGVIKEPETAMEVDIEKLFENERVYIDSDPESNTSREYFNNLEYYKEELYRLFKSSNEVVSFLYYDIITGYSFSFNADVEFPTSSAIKANLAIYIMDLVSQGKADLSNKLTYTEDFYNGGSGQIKTHAIGTQYTIDQLLSYMIIDSDNVAYLMLLNEFGHKNAQEYWFNLGATTTYNRGSSWGSINAKDALLYMRRLYSFYREDEHYGKKLMDLFTRARFRYLFRAVKDFEIAHKSGYTAASTNDLSLVLEEHPFIFIVLTRKNAFYSENMDFFTKPSADIMLFHKYFWDNIGYKYTP